MDQNKYILALDVGGRRIGVALASSVARLPAPLTYIDRETVSDVNEAIKKLVDEHQASVLVVGLPRGMNGQETAQTAAIRSFATGLSDLNIPIVLQDEAVTSAQAEEMLKTKGKPYSKGDIDAMAASIILDDYMQEQVRQTA